MLSVREFKDEAEEKCHEEKLEVRKQFPETNPPTVTTHPATSSLTLLPRQGFYTISVMGYKAELFSILREVLYFFGLGFVGSFFFLMICFESKREGKCFGLHIYWLHFSFVGMYNVKSLTLSSS